MQLASQLLFELFFGQRRHRYGFARRSGLALAEVEGQEALSLHRYAGKFRGLEAPLFCRPESGFTEHWMAADGLRIHHLAALTYRDLDLDCALRSRAFGYWRVSRLNFPGRLTLHDACGNREFLRAIRYLRRNPFGWRRRWRRRWWRRRRIRGRPSPC